MTTTELIDLVRKLESVDLNVVNDRIKALEGERKQLLQLRRIIKNKDLREARATEKPAGEAPPA